MIKKKILIVAPYPIVNPAHGGQKRINAIYEYYRKIFEEVKYTAVFHRGFYEDKGPDDLWLGDPEIIKQLDNDPFNAELIQGTAIDKDIHVRSYMAKLLQEYKPDVIHIEQIYPYAGLKPLLDELQMRPLIIMGSQNIEYKMKQNIFNDQKEQSARLKDVVQRIKTLEEKFSKEADLVIAVSKSDLIEHKKMGARHCVLAPNGINKTEPKESVRKKWLDYKKEKDISALVSFIGSGHPPNWIGFNETVGQDTMFLSKDQKIMLVGGVSDYFTSKLSPKKDFKQFWGGVIALGKVSEDDLAGIISVSDVILLPVTRGGGSNLKTAEAILSGKKVVTTDFALRGYEKYSQLPNLYIAKSKDQFNKKLTKALQAAYVTPSKRESRLIESVQWIYCLQPIEKEIKKLIFKNKLKSKARNVKRYARPIKNFIP